MELQVFAIYDAGISTWQVPMFARAKGEILRWWMSVINNPQSEYSKHPGDYTLFEIGKFDDQSCKFELFKAPIKIGTAIEFVKPVEVSNTK